MYDMSFSQLEWILITLCKNYIENVPIINLALVQMQHLWWQPREQIWPSNFKIFLLFWEIVIPDFQQYANAVA